MIVGAYASYRMTLLLLHHPGRLTSAQRLDIGCFEFLGWWWVAYFTLSYRRSYHEGNRAPPRYSLFTLRSYLDQISSHRGRTDRAAPKLVDDDELLREKARSSRDVQGIMIAVVVLILTLVTIDSTSRQDSLSEYQHIIEGPIFMISLVIILVWALSLDGFDTVLNSFQVLEDEAYSLRRWFYGYLGPFTRDQRKGRPFIAGAVSYGYIGHALIPIFALMVFSWFQPTIIGFGTAVYVFFAYPYYYGYWAIKTKSQRVPRAEVQKTDLRRLDDWQEIDGGGEVELLERWVVNRDGDRAIREWSGAVPRDNNESPCPRLWPHFGLGIGLLIISTLSV